MSEKIALEEEAIRETGITTKIEPPKTLTTYFHAFVAPPRGMVIFKKILFDNTKPHIFGDWS